ncbi:MAG TPA: DUF2065 domain-containing protein [Azospirillaceae bacterium]|nr:DUF2065 domain-containing protein [Azospirillaceae bacterium]
MLTDFALDDLGTALALVLVIEGILYSLFPNGMRRMMAQTLEMPAGTLRWVGLATATVGVGIVWVIRSG